MQYYFIDINSDLTQAWKQVFQDVEQVTVINDSIFDHPSDALVSPANSFGYMNGGIDFSISKHLGWHVEKTLQQKIRSEYHGELLVGQATLVETQHSDFPYLISAPTMRTPTTIWRTPNVYLATKAILTLVQYGTTADGEPIRNKINRVAIPGLGTGVGQMPPLVAARQMRLAWEDVMKEKFKTKEAWKELQSNYRYFYTHDKEDLTYDIP